MNRQQSRNIGRAFALGVGATVHRGLGTSRMGYHQLQNARQGLVETQARNFLSAPSSTGGPCMKHKASNS